MIREEPVQIVEIDLDQCSLTFGVGTCTAALSVGTQDKCRNTWATCKIAQASRDSVFDKGTPLTLRFIKSRPKMPIDGKTYFPRLKSVSTFSSTVNIVGFKQDLGSLGRRGTVTVNLEDFPYNDMYTDKYALERKSGDAQYSGIGYDPLEKSTFWTKIRKWSPNYAGRPLRVIDTYIYLDDNGTPQWGPDPKVRHFIMTDIKQDFDSKSVTVEGKDILSLAEKKSAVAPKVSNGSLATDISSTPSSFDLEPAGIGNLEYPTSGYAVIGKEVVTFTRSGDTITLTGRGQEGTEAKTHKAGDTFQIAKKFTGAFINEVVDYLLNETEIDPSFFDSSEYADEVSRWAPTLRINTVLTKSEAVTKYLGELTTLGVSMWWDELAQKIKLKMNHPLDYTETVTPVSDDSSIKAISVDEKDEERLTQVHFYSVQSDPTQSVDDKENYDRITVIVDSESQGDNFYGDTRIKEVFCRWFNTGNDAAVRTIGTRYLQRFNQSPKYHSLTVDKKDGSVNLADIIAVTSEFITDENGSPIETNLQVIGRSEIKSGHEVKYTLQSYDFAGNSSFIMENDANPYGSATDLELERGCYIVGPSLEFPDGREAYTLM